MLSSFIARALASAFAAAALCVPAQSLHAGHAAHAPHAATAASAPPAAAKPATPTTYRSAFDGYRRFVDAEPVPWRSANDTVGRIGGWRAYAREAAQAAPAAAKEPQ